MLLEEVEAEKVLDFTVNSRDSCDKWGRKSNVDSVGCQNQHGELSHATPKVCLERPAG